MKSELESNISKLEFLIKALNENYVNDIDAPIIIEDIKHSIKAFNTMSTREQNITLHKYIDKITINTLINTVSVYLKFHSPGQANSADIILEKTVYSEFLK